MATINDWLVKDEIGIQAGMEIQAAVRENFEDHPDGGHKCKLCGARVAHPRAAAAHLAVHHRKALESAGTSEGASKGWDTRGRKGPKDEQGRTGGRHLSGKLGPEHFKALEKLAKIHEQNGKRYGDSEGMYKSDAADVRKFASLVKSGDFRGADKHGASLDTDPRERLYTFRRVGPAISRAWKASDPEGYAKHANYLDQSTWKRRAGGTGDF